jgi:hypothetical protein
MITGQNLFVLAVRYSCTEELIDYLLEQNISATEYDLRRYLLSIFRGDCTDLDRSWNALHVAADRTRLQFLHLLEKIPREDVDSMLVQQSKPYLNTVRCCTIFGLVQRLIGFSLSLFISPW